MNKIFLSAFLTVNLVALSLLYSCQSKSEVQFSSTSVENNNSILIELLLKPNDFDKQNYDLDFSSLFQDNLEGDLFEKASAWIVTFRLPEDEYFLVSHGLFLLNISKVDIDDLLIFRYTDINSFYELSTKSNIIEGIHCVNYKINKECLFFKKYDDILSILSIEVENHVSDEKLVEWTLPLLEIIDNRMQEYTNKR